MDNPKNAKTRPWGGIRERRGRFYVTFRAEGRQLERGPFSTRKTADTMRNRARALLEVGTPLADVLGSCFGDITGTTLTFRDATPLYLAWAASPDPEGRPRKKATTLLSDTFRLNAIQRAAWAAKPLSLVTPADLEKWHEARRSAASSSTANRDLSVVSAVFRWAGRPTQGYVDSNPARKVEKFSEKGRARTTHLTASECDTLLAACSDDLRPLAIGAIHTGARQGQLIALEWKDVDFDRHVVHFRAEQDKSGVGRDVPMTSALESCLLGLHKAKTVPLKGKDLVFRRARKPWLGQTILDHLARAVAACGDDAPEDRRLPESKRTGLRWHDLRHTTASLLVTAGVPLFDVAKILGHKRIETTMRYAHLAPESGRKAIDGLAAALTTKTAPAAGAKAGQRPSG